MKLVGITRVRNEEKLIQNTLNHVAGLVDEIYVYDDCSEDHTPIVCEQHPAVKKVIKGTKWADTTHGRNIAEGRLRQIVYEEAKDNGADWVYCFDADEFADFRLVDRKVDFSLYDSIALRLFDFYITQEDIEWEYFNRRWIGPEYRDIPMLFKVRPELRFTQRAPRNIGRCKHIGGYVKHYGKAMSVEQWEKDCEYYSSIRWKDLNPVLQKRWEDRKGKAVHTRSDFGRELITWQEKENKSKIVKI